MIPQNWSLAGNSLALFQNLECVRLLCALFVEPLNGTVRSADPAVR